MKKIRFSTLLIIIVDILMIGAIVFFWPRSDSDPDETAAESQISGASITRICELATLDCYYHNVTEWKYSGNALDPSKKIWMEYEGFVRVGIQGDQVKVSAPDKDGVVTVTMPSARILQKDLDEDNASALREKINRAWKEVYYQLGRNENEPLSDDEFLRAHWIMYFAYSRKKGDDYIQFLLRKFSHKSIFENVLAVPAAEPDPEEEIDPESADDEDALAPAPVETMSGQFLRPEEIADYVNSLNETAEYWYYTFYPFW